MGKKIKTNAMRILDKENIDYEFRSYDTSDGKIDGVSVAAKVGRSVDEVFKTLVAVGNTKEIYVFVIPVAEELDLKKAAVSCGEKSVSLIHVKEILNITGYIRGGCSPIGMKKPYKTYIDESAYLIDKIIVSGGKIGVQIELKLEDLIKISGAEIASLIK